MSKPDYGSGFSDMAQQIMMMQLMKKMFGQGEQQEQSLGTTPMPQSPMPQGPPSPMGNIPPGGQPGGPQGMQQGPGGPPNPQMMQMIMQILSMMRGQKPGGM